MHDTIEDLRARMEKRLGLPVPRTAHELDPAGCFGQTERDEVTPVPFVLREWRRVSIPEWRAKLASSIRRQERDAESYARWMLKEVLLDMECSDE